MAEFVFPEIKAHFATVMGRKLIFSPGTGSVLTSDEAGFDFAQSCFGWTIGESRKWLLERYGEASGNLVYDWVRMVKGGYFNEPRLDFAECESGLPPPVKFGICTTHRCNMQCKYCFASHARRPGRQKDISPDIARAAVDFLFDVLKPPFVTITLGLSGEPQLNWDAIQGIIDYANKRSEETCTGVSYHINTNGLRARSELLQYLRTHDDMSVAISWDGPKDIHDAQRLSHDGSGTYERVSNTFDILRRTLRSRPLILATVTALNPDVAGIFTHHFDNGVRDLIIQPLRSSDPELAVSTKSLYAFKTGFSDLAELLLKPDYIQTERLFAILTECDGLGRYICRVSQGSHLSYRCMAARNHYEITTDGGIYPCPSLVDTPDFLLGNVHDGIDDVKLRSFREKTFLGNVQACSGCWAKRYCGGPCAYVSAITSGRIGVPDAPQCELTKHLIELAAYIVARLNSERPGLLSHVLALRSPVPTGRRSQASCYRAKEGDLWTCPAKDWRIPTPILLDEEEHLGGSKQWPQSTKCHARVHPRWDDNYLYVMVEVEDAVFTPPAVPEGEWWLRDSVQFALDPGKDGGQAVYPWQLPEGDYEFGVASAGGRTHLYDCQADPLRPAEYGAASVVREGMVTTYRVAIPWSRIHGFVPSVGAECRFSVVVNDSDGDVRGWLQWTHGLATRKAPARFGLLRLVG